MISAVIVSKWVHRAARFAPLQSGLEDFEVGNTCKVFLVERQNGQVIVEGGCGEKYVNIRNDLAGTPKVGTDFSKLFADR